MTKQNNSDMEEHCDLESTENESVLDDDNQSFNDDKELNSDEEVRKKVLLKCVIPRELWASMEGKYTCNLFSYWLCYCICSYKKLLPLGY